MSNKNTFKFAFDGDKIIIGEYIDFEGSVMSNCTELNALNDEEIKMRLAIAETRAFIAERNCEALIELVSMNFKENITIKHTINKLSKGEKIELFKVDAAIIDHIFNTAKNDTP